MRYDNLFRVFVPCVPTLSIISYWVRSFFVMAQQAVTFKYFANHTLFCACDVVCVFVLLPPNRVSLCVLFCWEDMDGCYLCSLMAGLQENIKAYTDATKQLGVPDHYNFVTVRLMSLTKLSSVSFVLCDSILETVVNRSHSFARLFPFAELFKEGERANASYKSRNALSSTSFVLSLTARTIKLCFFSRCVYVKKYVFTYTYMYLRACGLCNGINREKVIIDCINTESSFFICSLLRANAFRFRHLYC